MPTRAPILPTSLLWALVLLLMPFAAGCGTSEGDPADSGAASADSSSSFFKRAFRSEPTELTLPAGTLVPVRFDRTLSSHSTSVGTEFRARVIQEIAVDGATAIAVDSVVLGTVTLAEPARKIGGRARLGLSFHTLELPSGDSYSIAAAFAQAGRSEAPKDAAIIGGSTLGGAILGEAIDKGDGTVVGAIVGGIAGTVGALKTQGKPVEVPAGSVMSLELQSPLTLTVD